MDVLIENVEEKNYVINIGYFDTFLHYKKDIEKIRDFYLLFFVEFIKDVFECVRFDMEISLI